MRRCGAVGLLGLALLLTASSPAQAADSPTPASYVEARQRATGVPGVAWAVVGPDGVEQQGTAGVDGTGAPVTPRTPFLWGSVSKPVAATLLVLMADAGEVDLDAPLTDVLPEFRTADQRSTRTTLRHLLTHTSGLPELLGLTDRYDTDRRPADVLPQLEDVVLVADPGAEHHYSSVNYLLAAAVVEEVAGRPFAEVLTERVLRPAGMTSTLTTTDDAERLPPGHRWVLGSPRPFTSGFDPAGVAYGYLGGTLEDAVAFARANLPGGTLLDDDARVALVDDPVPTGPGSAYGLGWRTSPVPGTDEPMTWHSGAAPGYSATVALLPEQDRAVVVLQNAYGPFQEEALLDTGFGIAAVLLGAPPPAHGTDPLYVGVVGGLGTLVAAATLALVVTGLRRDRRRRRPVVGLVVRLVGCAVVVGGLLSLPRVFGIPLSQVPLWAPDVAALVVAGVALTAALAVVGTATSVYQLIQRRGTLTT